MQNKWVKILLVVILIIVIGVILYSKPAKHKPEPVINQVNNNPQAITNTATSKALPRLVDLGAGKCIPCKKMAPILKELKEEFKGIVNVEFIDVWENASAGDEYGIKLIPTQIFYDAEGDEVFRHEGFFSREEILEQFKGMGVDISNAKKE